MGPGVTQRGNKRLDHDGPLEWLWNFFIASLLVAAIAVVLSSRARRDASLSQPMSMCSCSFRALSRSRLPSAKTLTPFLYQTATIQQWQAAARPVARRNASSNSNSRHDPDIPFEDDTGSHHVVDAEPARSTTITGSERAAFETLYKKFRPTRPPRSNAEHESDEIADEYYEDEEENEADADANAASLDSLFDSVLSGKSKPRNTDKTTVRRLASKRGQNDDIATLAEQILGPVPVPARSEKAMKAAKIKTQQAAEKARVVALLQAAKTDRELWIVLEKEVFAVLKELNLDGQTAQGNKTKSEKKKAAHQTSSSDQTVVDTPSFPTSPTDTPYKSAKRSKRDLSPRDPRLPNVPVFLVTAARTLHIEFPASPLLHAIIPTLKSLGRSSYALGATTSLYRIAIHSAWRQQHSYDLVCSLLQDMDNGGIEPDYNILQVLNDIIKEYHRGRYGELGRAVRNVFAFQAFKESIDQILVWRDVMSKRLGVWGEQRVAKGTIVRKVSKGEAMLERGPRDELVVPEVGGDVGSEPRLKSGVEDVPLVEGGAKVRRIESGTLLGRVPCAKGGIQDVSREEGGVDALSFTENGDGTSVEEELKGLHNEKLSAA
jgi:hypothetical protein